MTAPVRLLVTGGAGFIGSHLARRRIAGGDEVHLLLRPGTATGRIDALPVVRHVVDADADPAALDAVVAAVAPEEVYHLAAQTRRARGVDAALDAATGDLALWLRLLGAAARLRRPPRIVVRAGTLAEYGRGVAPYRETQREAPADVYGAAMAAATHFGQMLQPELPFAVVTARLGLTYGPEQSDDFLVPRLIRDLGAGRPVHVAAPRHRRDLVHVDDVVTALCRIGARPDLRGEILNIATGAAPTMAEVAVAVCRVLDRPRSLLSWGDGRAGGTMELVADVGRAAERLGWRAAIRLEDGLARTAAASLAANGRELCATLS